MFLCLIGTLEDVLKLLLPFWVFVIIRISYTASILFEKECFSCVIWVEGLIQILPYNTVDLSPLSSLLASYLLRNMHQSLIT